MNKITRNETHSVLETIDKLPVPDNMDKILIRLIPHGQYCTTYLNEYRYECPYHSFRKGYEEYEDGYCSYLGKGDYELNRERHYVMKRTDGTVVDEGTAFDMGELKLSTLYDQVKMCDINMLDDKNNS